MKKFSLVGAALLVVLAFSALSVASASAVEFLLAEWLLNNGTITSALGSDTEGKIILGETILGIKIEAECTGIIDGTIGSAAHNGEDTITKVLNAAGTEETGVKLVGTALVCVNHANCPEPLVWPVNLPWNTLAELMIEGTETFMVDLILSSGAGSPGWEVQCMGSTTSDECTTAEGITRLTNEPTDVEGFFEESFTELAGLELANCVTGGPKTGTVNSVVGTGGLILLTEGGTLQVSSE